MKNDVSIWRMPQTGDTEFVQVDSMNSPIPRQVAFTGKLVYFERGAKRFRLCRKDYLASAGDLLWVARGEVYEATPPLEEIATLRVLQLPGTLWVDFLPEKLLLAEKEPHFSSPFVTDPRVVQHFRRLHRKPESFASELEQTTCFLHLLESLCTEQKNGLSLCLSSHREKKSITTLKDYLEAHYAEAITLAHLAQLTGWNATYLCRAFTQSVGMPPHAYQTALRIERARVLLRQGVSVGEVAQRVGFYDQAHFTRHFRRLFYLPPAKYAEQVKNVQDRLPS